ncbi:MAG: VTT domain-containing protein [Dehalococcoidia bacterium]|nr:VTT domain-containing protein [Dehalococcoidia bacterium]
MWERWAGLLALLVTFGLAILLALNWRSVESIAAYGYIGGFAASFLGGGTVFVPIPMAAVQFTLGGLLPAPLGPSPLGPLYVSLVCALGESLGAVTIYMAGVSGSSFIPRRNQPPGGRLGRMYEWLLRVMKRRGALVMFCVSVIMNPFFVPVTLAFAANRMGIRKYFGLVFAGKLVKVTAIAYAGYYGMRGIFNALGIDV